MNNVLKYLYRIQNGYTITENSNNLQEPSTRNFILQKTNDTFEMNYHFDEIVEYICQPGYKFRGNYNLSSEFKLRCAENGTWIGFVPDCVPLKCPWPSIINNARIFLRTRNDTIELFKRRPTNVTNLEIISEESEDSFEEDTILEEQFIIGSEILIKCDTGYKLIDSDVRICMNNAEWSSGSSSCEPQECPVLNHPVFRLLYKGINLDNHTDILGNNQSIKNRDYYSESYGNIEFFVEGYTYMKRIILSCGNNVEIKLNDESVSNLTWSCNEYGEWTIINSMLNTTTIEDLLKNKLNDICQELECASITVSNIELSFELKIFM